MSTTFPSPGTWTQRRHTAACSVVFNDRGWVLLQRRADNQRWSLPGGAIEPGETAAAAAERETLEETGCRVLATRLIGVYSDPAHTTRRLPDGTLTAYVALAFECVIVGGRPTTSVESTEVAWFDPRALPDGLTEGHRVRIDDALTRQSAAFLR